MSRSELVRLSGVSKQQLSRLENGHIRLRLDHLKPFASHLGYTPEQMLLWGRYPGTGTEVESDGAKVQVSPDETSGRGRVSELDARGGRGKAQRKGSRNAALKSEVWVFPPSFVREQLNASAERLLVFEMMGDSMAPTIMPGDRIVLDTSLRTPTPDGLYAIRDAMQGTVVKRLQLLQSARPPRVKIISDNSSLAVEEIPLGELEIVGKVVCCLKLF